LATPAKLFANNIIPSYIKSRLGY